MEKRFKGIGVSPGVAIGQALILESKKPCFIYQFLLNTSEVKKEIEHFKKTVESVKKEFKQLAKSLKKETTFKEVRQILEIYISILSDPMLYKATIKRIKEEKINAEWALLKSLEEIENVFGMIEEDYLKQRIQDVHYVVNRILAILQPRFPSAKQSFPESVIIGHDLSPVEAIKLSSKIAIAFVTETGSLTSHIAIVTQALKLPAVVGVKEITNFIKPAEMVIVDGFQGEVIINPLAETLQYYQERRKEYKQYCDKIEHYALLPARTLEGHTLKVMANVELFEEIPSVLKMGADGIGLFRTEFFYLQQKRLPEEKLLYEYFSKVVKAIKPYPVTFRTLDMGGDKLSSALKFEKELNPALGLRAIRFCLKQKNIFRTQLRAILRASAHGDIRILFPLISSLEEIKEAKELLEQVKAELEEERVSYKTSIPVGIMVEVPSAVTLINFLIREIDFLSIGTNDLIQYTLAIDRSNEQVAYLYEPLHPAVLKMIKEIVDVAHQAKVPVNVCGEMAGNPIYIPVLVGLGVNEISLNAQNIPLIKKVLCSISFKEAQNLAKKLVTFGSISEVRECYFNTITIKRLFALIKKLIITITLNKLMKQV